MSVKVIDTFLFSGEIDLLELRLNELFEIVDEFVIVEANTSFTGRKKDFSYLRFESHFHQFASKIKYIQILEDRNFASPWAREEFQRNFASTYLLTKEDDSLIILSDLDEILYSNVIEQIKNLNQVSVYGFQLDWHYFAFDFKLISGPELEIIVNCAFPKTFLNQYSLQQLRSFIRDGKISSTRILKAGAHLSYFMDRDEILKKLNNFSHQEFNESLFHSRVSPAKLIKNGEDIFNRPGYAWRYQPSIPNFEYLQSNIDKFSKYFCANILIEEMNEMEFNTRAMILEIEAQIKDLRDSISWKLTKPLRKISSLIRN